MHDKKCNSFEDIGKLNNENSNQLKDDEISIENKSPEESHITINDINVVEQMNMARFDIDSETSEEAIGRTITEH